MPRRSPEPMRMIGDSHTTRHTRPAVLRHAFAPVYKLALGAAVGFISGLGLAAVTIFHVVLDPPGAPPLHLLGQFFYGYELSWAGALIGFCWAFFTGFVAGWFLGFVHNLVTAITVFIFKTKGELAQTKDFLDHI